MTATANASFMENSDFRGSSSFFWTMIALAVLDVMLLFWLVNPLAKPASNARAARADSAQVHVAQAEQISKPSPFGAVVRNGVR